MIEHITQEEQRGYFKTLKSIKQGDTREKSVEMNTYHLIAKYLERYYHENLEEVRVSLTAPHQTDCLLTVESFSQTQSILIEAKYSKNHSQESSLHETLAQAIYYLKAFKESIELMPAIVITVNTDSMQLFKTEDLEYFVNKKYPVTAACKAFANAPELLEDLSFASPDYEECLFSSTGDLNKFLSSMLDSLFKSKFKLSKFLAYEPVVIDPEPKIKELVEVASRELKSTFCYNSNHGEWHRLTGDGRWTLTRESRVLSESLKVAIDFNVSIPIPFLSNESFGTLLIRILRKSLENNSVGMTIAEANESLITDFILSWFNETLKPESDYFVTIMDLLESYNEWAVSRGHSRLSIRTFGEVFKAHPLFLTHRGLQYKRAGFLRKELQQSRPTPNHPLNDFPNSRATFVEGVRFK